MTILPKQKAAGTAPKKSVNRDGNHSRDIGHERQVLDSTFTFITNPFGRFHFDDVKMCACYFCLLYRKSQLSRKERRFMKMKNYMKLIRIVLH